MKRTMFTPTIHCATDTHAGLGHVDLHRADPCHADLHHVGSVTGDLPPHAVAGTPADF